MDPYTHLACGFLLGSLPPAQGLGWVGTAATVAGSVAPDLDFVTRRLGGTRFLYHHHGATHSLMGIALSSALVATGLLLFRPEISWLLLWSIAFAAGLLHDLLDILMHNTGVQLWFPLRRERVAHPLLIGVNPPYLEEGCGDGRYLTCFICQFRQSLRNPVWWILTTGGVANLLSRLLGSATGARLSSVLAFSLSGLVLGGAEIQRRRARRRAGLGTDVLVVPAASGFCRYLVLKEEPASVRIRRVDLRTGELKDRRVLRTWMQDPLIRRSESLPDVIRFRWVARIPHAEILCREPETLLEWSDLSYSYPSPHPLFRLRLALDPSGQLKHAEFRERW